MFCYNCWTLLPEESPYCWKCGRPQKPVLPVATPQWETCEIVYASEDAYLFANKFHFRARAMGPDGVYTAGKSEEFDSLHVTRYDSRDEAYEDAMAALNDLIQDLVKDGWQLQTTRGPAWYSYRFRRLAK